MGYLEIKNCSEYYDFSPKLHSINFKYYGNCIIDGNIKFTGDFNTNTELELVKNELTDKLDEFNELLLKYHNI